MQNRRTRNWGTIVYTESAPENWKTILEEQHVPALVSPLHDMDIDANGEIKKEHYHVMLMFNGVKTAEQAHDIFTLIGGVGTEEIKSVKAYARYLCHLDNPDKAQYNTEDVLYFSGADYGNIIHLSTDKYSAIGEMIEFCIENDIVSYAELLLFAKNNRNDWFRVLCDNGTITIVQFLKSRYWETNRYYKDTGD